MRAIEIYTDMVSVACCSCLALSALFVLCCGKQWIWSVSWATEWVSAAAHTPLTCCLCPLHHLLVAAVPKQVLPLPGRPLMSLGT